MSFFSLGLLIFFGFVGVFFGLALVKIYNSLVELRLQIDRSWANIDVVLEQRFEEIPKLITICEQYLSYERSTIDKLIDARKRYSATNKTADKINIANQTSENLNGLIALAEAYPQLNSNTQFLQLQSRISVLESQIADRKELVNDCVTNFNIRCRQFPDLFFAAIMGFSTMPLYKVAPVVKTTPSLKINIPS